MWSGAIIYLIRSFNNQLSVKVSDLETIKINSTEKRFPALFYLKGISFQVLNLISEILFGVNQTFALSNLYLEEKPYTSLAIDDWQLLKLETKKINGKITFFLICNKYTVYCLTLSHIDFNTTFNQKLQASGDIY